MKKLMSIASAMLCVTALASLDPSTTSLSSGVVGYASTAARANLNWYSPVFRTIGYNTTDINEVNLDDGGTGEVGWGDSMQIVGPLGSPSEAYLYWDPSVDPTGSATKLYWGDDSGTPVNVTLEPGAGFAIDNVNGLTFNIVITCPYAL